MAMLISGCANSLLNKFQDKQCVGNCSAPPSEQHLFEQPVFQTVQMFIAEFLVVLVVLINRWQARRAESQQGYQQIASDDEDEQVATESRQIKLTGKKILLLAIPATCDICGTTLMNIGLLAVPVSIYQMVRGAIVLFVGSFSIIFLKRTLTRKQWIGLLSVTAGVSVVGLSAVGGGEGKESTNELSGLTGFSWESLVGVLLIMLAQVFSASQFVFEEFLLEKYTMEPLQVVAWEGAFGTLITVTGSALAYIFFVKGDGKDSMFNLAEGFRQVLTIKPLLLSSILIMFMMSTFNVSGLAVTRVLSATSRSTIDTSRTVGIWAISLLIGWESFKLLQLLGFAVLVYGTLLFNGIIQGDEETRRNADELLPNEFEHT